MGLGCERHADPSELIALAEQVLAENGLAPASLACHRLDRPQGGRGGNPCRRRAFRRARALLHGGGTEPRNSAPQEPVRHRGEGSGRPRRGGGRRPRRCGPRSELIVEKTRSAARHLRHREGSAADPRPCRAARAASCMWWASAPARRTGAHPPRRAALDASTDWVGYGLYLDLAADVKSGQQEHRFPLGGEEDRVRHAIALAKEGKEVALICSGDAGIYAMAALVYEVIDLEPSRIAVNVIPGISAFQAAAAKAGAMIGHDFCCISLSDLLTPWEAIEKRVTAAAEGDFVISFYNPRSLKRRDQLERAFAILKQHRPADTPVVIASNLGRPEEQVKIVRFADFNPDDVDMLTLVMVGSSQSKSFTRGDGRPTPTRRAAMRRRERQRNDRPFHRRRPRRTRPHHRARAEDHPVLPRLPLCRLAGAGGDRQGRTRRCPRHRHRPHDAGRDHRRDRSRACQGPGRGPRPLGRSVALWRHRRADPPAGQAGHSL